MLYTMEYKKDNKVYMLKNTQEVALKDSKDLFIVKLDGSRLYTYDEFEKVAKAAFQTPTDKSTIWLNEAGNPFSWVEYLDWLMDARFNSFVLIVENWSKTLARENKKENLLWEFQYICDFWGYEILRIAGNGHLETESEYTKPRDFNIYLVG